MRLHVLLAVVHLLRYPAKRTHRVSSMTMCECVYLAQWHIPCAIKLYCDVGCPFRQHYWQSECSFLRMGHMEKSLRRINRHACIGFIPHQSNKKSINDFFFLNKCRRFSAQRASFETVSESHELLCVEWNCKPDPRVLKRIQILRWRDNSGH